ncbi:hypothetical protein RA276_27610, partial [Pseudomonas syringae pv. tagetis]|uniref:hypothetical protein n=1 Tax=Pseudomonas syringae group genomosp. 7 TaxID=251699 RepID=UPI00376F49D2
MRVWSWGCVVWLLVVCCGGWVGGFLWGCLWGWGWGVCWGWRCSWVGWWGFGLWGLLFVVGFFGFMGWVVFRFVWVVGVGLYVALLVWLGVTSVSILVLLVVLG